MTRAHHLAQLFPIEVLSGKLFFRLVWNHDPFYLSLLNSFDYKGEPLAAGGSHDFYIYFQNFILYCNMNTLW
jgi:hypothetical protein